MIIGTIIKYMISKNKILRNLQKLCDFITIIINDRVDIQVSYRC